MDKELLFKPRLTEDTVELEGVGTVRIRALARNEVTDAREGNTDDDGRVDSTGYECALVSMSMVDPELTPAEVHRWAAVSPAGEWVKVMNRIQSLSGLDGDEATKSRVRPNRQERRTKVRTRSGS